MREHRHEFRTVAIPETTRRYVKRPRPVFLSACMWLVAIVAMLCFVMAVTPR